MQLLAIVNINVHCNFPTVTSLNAHLHKVQGDRGTMASTYIM